MRVFSFGKRSGTVSQPERAGSKMSPQTREHLKLGSIVAVISIVGAVFTAGLTTIAYSYSAGASITHMTDQIANLTSTLSDYRQTVSITLDHINSQLSAEDLRLRAVEIAQAAAGKFPNK